MSKQHELRELLFGVADDTISEEDFETLQTLFESDPDSIEDYLLLRRLDRTLHELARKEASQNVSPTVVPENRPFIPGFTGGVVVAACLVTLMLVSISVFYFGNRNDRLASNVPEPSVPKPKAAENAPSSGRSDTFAPAAVVTAATSDVQLGGSSVAPDFMMLARIGERIQVTHGIVELKYASGAKLILAGPCKFVVTSRTSGRLEQGKLTGTVTSGDFRLTTPVATVIDLGTEFGVSLNEGSDMDVHVFEGEVIVSSNLAPTNGPNETMLTEGMSASVNLGGNILRTSNIDLSKFVREVPRVAMQRGNQISLVDLLNALPDGDVGIASAIDPESGQIDLSPARIDHKGKRHRFSTGFHHSEWHPFVDGVFVPPEHGNDIVINSAGDMATLPRSSGRTWGPLWSRRRSDGLATIGAAEDFWGTMTLQVVTERLAQCSTGLIGMHANLGVTFDLEEIRNRFGQVDSFAATIANLDNSSLQINSKRDPEHEARYQKWRKINKFAADFRVYVDGSLRESLLEITRRDGELGLAIPLKPSDRFLTLISTDENEYEGYDHVVVIDPVVKLKSPNERQ